MRQIQVAAAIVADPAGPPQQFLLAHNARWDGYAFPMRDFDPDAQPPQRAAITRPPKTTSASSCRAPRPTKPITSADSASPAGPARTRCTNTGPWPSIPAGR